MDFRVGDKLETTANVVWTILEVNERAIHAQLNGSTFIHAFNKIGVIHLLEAGRWKYVKQTNRKFNRRYLKGL